MKINNRTRTAGKAILAAAILVAVLTLAGCTGISAAPQGGTGVTVAGGKLYVCPLLRAASTGLSCSTPTLQGKLVALNESGAIQWTATLRAPAPSGGFGCAQPSGTAAVVYGAPAVSGDLVYLADYTGKVYAISASTQLSKDVYLNSKNPQPIIGAPVATGSRVYLGSSDNSIYALDAASLDKVWSFATKGKVWATPALAGDTLYIGSFDRKLYALDANTGAKKWDFTTDGSIVTTAVVDSGTVYFSSFDRNLYALNAADGTEKWHFMGTSLFWAKPVILNNIVYAACLDNKIYALDAATGNKIADFTVGPVSASPAVSGTNIIFVTQKGVVCLLDTASKQTRQLVDLAETVYAPVTVSGNVVYVYTESQNLYSISLDSGAKLWTQSVK